MIRTTTALCLMALAGCQSETAIEPAGTSASTGPGDYAMLCAGCHGASGKGDGADAAGLDKAPADLTALAAANGGAFPMARVLGHIWGYTEATGAPVPDRTMPDFGSLLQSELVLFDAGDGIATPTPSRLVELAVYIESLQAK